MARLERVRGIPRNPRAEPVAHTTARPIEAVLVLPPPASVRLRRREGSVMAANERLEFDELSGRRHMPAAEPSAEPGALAVDERPPVHMERRSRSHSESDVAVHGPDRRGAAIAEPDHATDPRPGEVREAPGP